MELPSRPPCRVIIIGGGVSGIAMACQLNKVFNLNDYCIYDRHAGLGGCWWANTCSLPPIPGYLIIWETQTLLTRYSLDPGCAVDIPGFCYSYSFAQNPDFTQVFPPQAEILNYLSTVVKQYRVDQHFTGNVEWTDATWQEKKQTWLVTLQNIHTKQFFAHECQILISAVGGLVNPQELKVPGAEQFQGDIIHTARWKHELDLTDKHVAVIGNGGEPVMFMPLSFGSSRFISKRDSVCCATSTGYHQQNQISHTVYEGN
jgi:cation diffusion facilitator CzcD-associated flavoprotein CzcO